MPARPALLLLLSPLLLSATAPAAGPAAREAAAARAEAARLDGLAARAGNEAVRLRANRAAAAEEIVAAEAEIDRANLLAIGLSQALERRRARLAELQRPAASLLAGLVQMGRRPPLLALATEGSAERLVMTRALLDVALPAIRARTAALRQEIEASQRLAGQLLMARQDLAERRAELGRRQRRFAALETQANAQAGLLGGAALDAGDSVLRTSAEAESEAGEAIRRRRAASLGVELARFPPPPPRPLPPDAAAVSPPIAWQLPAAAPVVTGLAEISPAGVRARGLTLGTRAGAAIFAPSDGRIAFAGPFRSHSGVVIIDHGAGWMTLMTGVRTALEPGARVRRGDPLGRALGLLTVELSKAGRPQPAALIAHSSAPLSKGRANR